MKTEQLQQIIREYDRVLADVENTTDVLFAEWDDDSGKAMRSRAVRLAEEMKENRELIKQWARK